MPMTETNNLPGRVAAKVYNEPKENEPYDSKDLEAGEPELCLSKYAYPSERR